MGDEGAPAKRLPRLLQINMIWVRSQFAGSCRALSRSIPRTHRGLGHFSFSPKMHSTLCGMVYFCFFSLLCHMPQGTPGASLSPQGCRSLGTPLIQAPMARKGGPQAWRPWLRILFLGYGQGSQSTLLTVASADHGNPCGVRPHGSERKLQQPQRCGTADGSETSCDTGQERGIRGCSSIQAVPVIQRLLVYGGCLQEASEMTQCKAGMAHSGLSPRTHRP